MSERRWILAAWTQVAATREAQPDRIGRHRILDELGRGGMGVVYLAQASHTGRLVALKVMRQDRLSERMRLRFETEVRHLAQLEHPGIARLYEAHLDRPAEDGGPFFSMEWIDGEPITSHARDRQLTRPERLRLFARVCDAVLAAHQRSIVHLDLKPSNILVPVLAARNGLGVTLRDAGHFEDAEPILRQVREQHRLRSGENHPCFGNASLNLATLLIETGDLSEAEPLLTDAYAIRTETYPHGHLDAAEALVELRRLRLATGDPEAARDHVEAALRICGEQRSSRRMTARALLVDGASLTRLGRFAEAEKSLRRARELLVTSLGDAHPHAARTRVALVELYEDWGRRESADRWR